MSLICGLLLLAGQAPSDLPATRPKLIQQILLKPLARQDPHRKIIFTISFEESAALQGISWSIKGVARYALLPAWDGRMLVGIDGPSSVARKVGAQAAVTAEELFETRGALLGLKTGEQLQFYVKDLKSQGTGVDGNGQYSWTETVQDGLWRLDAQGGTSDQNQEKYADISEAELRRTPTGVELRFLWKPNTVAELGAGANLLGFTKDEAARILTFRLSEEDLRNGGMISKTNQGTIQGKPGDDMAYPVNLKATLILDIKPPGGKAKLALKDKSWLPTDDNTVHLRLTCEEGQPTKVKFQILDASQEKGTCLNSADENTDPDIEFDSSNVENGYTLGDKSAEKEDDCGRDETITLHARDWGAWCLVKAQAEIEGRWVDAEVEGGGTSLTVPLDDDDNRVGDAWQDEKGLPQGLDAAWDEAEIPGGQYNKGDGIGLYEKYRGFMIQGEHERLDPHHKHLFVYDPTGIVHKVDTAMAKNRSFSSVTQLRLRYVRDGEWTGPGSSADEKRVVNKNKGWGHKVDQHALHVELYKGDLAGSGGKFPVDMENLEYPLPSDFANWRTGNGQKATAKVMGAPGYAFPDGAKRVGGTPKDTIIIIIWEQALVQHVTWGGILGQAATLAAEKYGSDNMTMDQVFAQGKDGGNRVLKYLDEHPAQVDMAVDRLLQHVVVHEMLHGVNARHCKIDPLCLMNVPAFILNPMQVAFGSDPVCIVMNFSLDDDPFALNTDWPDHLCQPCFSTIAVSDDSGI